MGARTSSIEWKRISVEGAAIVVSILLAFSIDAWWNNYRDRSEERGILLGLRAEFEQNLAFIETELSYRGAVVASILKIFEASDGRTTIEPDVLDELIGDITWWRNIDYSRGAIDGVLQSGRLSLVENEELRRLLASLPSRYDSTTRSEMNDQHTTVNVVLPYLNTHASLGQIANTMAKGRPGTGLAATPPVYPGGEPRDHSELLGDPEFLGTLVQEHWNHLEAITAYQSLETTLETGLRLIEQELKE